VSCAEEAHVIDCDADPHVPNGWQVEGHKKGGRLEWLPEKVELYLSHKQQIGACIKGDKLLVELESLPVLNARVLDDLMANPQLIPEQWKGRHVYFWGTIYRHPSGDLRVRFLYWLGEQWNWFYYRLSGDWNSYSPAAILVA
jgi:hypothetical protein